MDSHNDNCSSSGGDNHLSLSVDELRLRLKGVRAEMGSMVTFRDAPAFEMVMRLNQRHKGNLVAALLKRNDISAVPNCTFSNGTAKDEEKKGLKGTSWACSEAVSVFVPEAYCAFLEAEMQKWMDPIRGNRDVNKRKRARTKEGVCSSDEGEIEDYSDDDVTNYSSTSSN